MTLHGIQWDYTATKQNFHTAWLYNKQSCDFKALNFKPLYKLSAHLMQNASPDLLGCKITYIITILVVLLYIHEYGNRVQDAPLCEFCRTICIADMSELTYILSRVRTLDLKEKLEVTLNGDQLKQMSFRSKSMYVLNATWHSVQVWEVCETGGQVVLLKTQSTVISLQALHLDVDK